MGLPCVCVDWLKHMTAVGLEAVKEVLIPTLWSAKAALAAAATALEIQVVADYQYLVLTQFDVQRVKDKILEKDWSSFAGTWQAVNVSHSLLIDLSSAESGTWKMANGDAADALDQNIRKLKGWIIVVSLCSFIVE